MEYLSELKLIVCVGSGGVGKTTTSAAIALRLAMEGKKVMVLTIDPAKRLANSLGLAEMGSEAHAIDLSGLPDAKGELWAMMLDPKHTMEQLIFRVASRKDLYEKIQHNRVYKHISSMLAGMQDYMAIEKIYDMISSQAYDVLVLDTPPVKNALDFLESPGRMVSFLDEKIVRWFLAPYQKKGWRQRMLMGTTAIVWKLLGHIFGEDFLSELAAFFTDFESLYDGFVERHKSVMDMLRHKETGFCVVYAPTTSSIEVANFFLDALEKRNLSCRALIANQVHQADWPEHQVEPVLGDLIHQVTKQNIEKLFARWGSAHERLYALVQNETLRMTQLEHHGQVSYHPKLYRQSQDIHDLEGLYRLSQYL